MFKPLLFPKWITLRRFALRLTGNGPDADDLVQSTVLRALENTATCFQDGTNLFKWSSKIMFNLYSSPVIAAGRNSKRSMTRKAFSRREVVEATQETEVELGIVVARYETDEHRSSPDLWCWFASRGCNTKKSPSSFKSR